MPIVPLVGRGGGDDGSDRGGGGNWEDMEGVVGDMMALGAAQVPNKVGAEDCATCLRREGVVAGTRLQIQRSGCWV